MSNLQKSCMELGENTLPLINQLKTIKDALSTLGDNYENTEENATIRHLELLIFHIKAAIIQHTLQFPEISTIVRHMKLLKRADSMEYVMSLLYQCYRYAYPALLLENSLKELPVEEQLDICLSKYGGKESEHDSIISVLGSEIMSKELYQYFRPQGNKQTYKFKHEYAEKYLDKLHSYAEPLCKHFGLVLQEKFLTKKGIYTNLSRDQIKSVFSLLTTKQYVVKNQESDFTAIFNCFPHAQVNPVDWRAEGEKNHEPNCSELYRLFVGMGIDMNPSNRDIIASSFIGVRGKRMKPDSLKDRGNKERGGLLEEVRALCSNSSI